VIGGVIFLLLTVGFFFQLPAVTAFWPWPEGRLSYIFISSIMAAIAAPLIWIGLSGEFAAARGGALNLAVASAGTSIYLFSLYARSGDLPILITAIASGIAAPLIMGIFLWSRRIPFLDQRPLPGIVKVSFVGFAVILLIVGLMLVFRAPVVFPWPLKPESSVIFGLIFLGAALYFLAALQVPLWHAARGQLLGFLAYDLVLIGPFLAHFEAVLPEHRLSLIIYTLVLVYSGGLAIYYLFINTITRSWKIQTTN
jgi:hypothetical protein